ncbi:MAG: hypothetical protein NXI31_09535 [bacterium]|nr:hypothetical protein [bacterium]
MNPIPTLSTVLFAAVVSTPTPPGVEWLYSLPAAKAKATTINRPILVYCWSEGSDYCGKLWRETLAVDEAIEPMGQFVCYSAKHGGDGVQDVFEEFGVRTLPTLLFLSPEGRAEDLIQGFIPIADFRTELARIERGEGTVSSLQSKIDQAEDGTQEDIEARWALAGKVQALGNQARHDQLMASITAADPKGKTLIGARVRLQELVKEALGQNEDGQDGGDAHDHEEETEEQRLERMRNWDLAPLYTHARKVPLAEARHEAWERIGNLEAQRKNMQAAFEAFEKAWKTCPEEKAAEWSINVARWVVDHGTERTSKEKKFALKLAESALDALKKHQKAEPAETDEQAAKYREYEAYCWNTIAWCHHLTGKKGPAIKAAKKAVELHESDANRAALKKIAKS